MSPKQITFFYPVGLLAFIFTIHLAPRVQAEEELPQLSWERTSWCARYQGEHVRVQCEDGPPARCLVAPGKQSDGQNLQRIQECIHGQAEFDIYLRRGAQVVRARAESPPGWHRDEKGRVFQVTFDLLKRIYLGTAYQPAFSLDEASADWGRVRFDMGLMVSWLDIEERNRHEMKALDGYVVIGDLESQALLFAYDMFHANRRPLMRLTTFFGKPLRHDLFMDLGWGFELLDLHARPHRQENLVQLEMAEVHAHWVLWQSADLYNHVGLRTGMGAEVLFDTEADTDSYALTPNVALDARFGLDRDGFHYLNGQLGWQMPVWLNGEAGETNARAWAKAGYEVIFLAINDQPLSLVVEAGMDYRDDLGPQAPRFDAQIMAGLRFSLWAPARMYEPLPSRR